ncbi:MAG: hypothetical protein QOI73_329 [Solirubrobacteraceae bacterium]|nr:hypothetical protein [Solirubrobacteraceae bacterium]
MLRTVLRRPSPAAIFALLVLVVIAAPLADAAQEAVKNPKARAAAQKKAKKVVRAQFADKAKFADNAGKVRGYSVGFAALPSRVVLTGPNGKLPAAVIPDGVGKPGPAGPPGPTGSSGGFSQVRIVFEQGNAGTEGVSTATAACNAGEKVTGGGHELVYPVRAAGATGPVEIEYSKPTVINAAAGTSGWTVQAARIPNQFVYNGTTVVPDPSPDKLVVIKAWAVCTSR